MMILTTSLVSTVSLANENMPSGNLMPTVVQTQTATKNASARVPVKRVPKFKLLRTNPYRKTSIAEGIDTDIDDDNIAPGYRRRDLNKLEPTDELSDYVTVRLAVARAKAMAAYRAKWQT
jgi:hypothetical protein